MNRHNARAPKSNRNHKKFLYQTQPTVQEQMQRLLQHITGSSLEAPADCTIACDKGHLTAHKLLLCNHSHYLRDILSKYPTAEHPIIVLTELNITDIKILVNYMYTGELVLTNDTSPISLLRAAQLLKIDLLTASDDDVDDPDNDSVDVDNEAAGSGATTASASTANTVNNDAPLSGVSSLLESSCLRVQLKMRGKQLASTANNVNNDAENGKQIHDFADDEDDDGINDIDDDLMMEDDDGLVMDEDNEHEFDSDVQETVARAIGQHKSQQDLQSQTKSQSQSQSQDLGKIRCHLCNIGLSDVKCLYRHVLTRHLPEKWGYKCEFCDREFSRDDHLMRHYTTKHKNMEFNREKIRETRRLNREMAKNFHDQISTVYNCQY